MRDQEFSRQGQEYSGPGEEISTPGREWSAGGREYGQTNGSAAVAKKRRRIPVAVAAAVATGLVLVSGPRGLPQPENFTEEYRAYLDQMMAACESGDERGLYRLATSDTASEIWEACLEPYRQELREQGFSIFTYYDGRQMVQELPEAPVLYFEHNEITQEEMWERNSAGRLYSHVTYFTDGAGMARGVQGMHYAVGYGGTVRDGAGREFDAEAPVRTFRGEMAQNASRQVTYLEGIYRRYNIGFSPNDTAGRLDLYETLEGRFADDERGVTYLEDGTLTVFFGDGSRTEIQVQEGWLRIEDNPSVTLAWSEDGAYAELKVYGPDHSQAQGSATLKQSERLEDHLYHNDETTAW